MFDPKTRSFPYPEDTGAHYIKLRENTGEVFDRDYPYYDTSFKMRFMQGLARALLYVLVFPVMRVRLGLRIKGRSNLRKHRAELKGGVISCSNHVHFWDYIAVMRAAVPYKTNLLAWADNLRGENRKLIRLVGGMPIPDHNVHGTIALNEAVARVLDGGWLHIYGEGSMWEYYQPIRPFKPGVAHYACRLNKPVLPMAFSYREPGSIRKKLFHQIALLTLEIGEPLFADGTLAKAEREEDLTVRCHEAVCRLAGIDPAENIYPPVYNNSRRIDYYEDRNRCPDEDRNRCPDYLKH